MRTETPSPAWRGPAAASGIILLGQAFPLQSPVRDAMTLLPATQFRLEFPLTHLVLTPFSSIADYLTVLSLREGIAVLSAILLAFVLLLSWKKSIVAFLAFVAFLAWAVLVPRSVPALRTDRPNTLIIDFHSHSEASHDGRKGFSADDNRRWHHAQGYDAAFITDHNATTSAEVAKEASRADWRRTGYRSLMGQEVSLWKTHLAVLGVKERIDNGPWDSDPAKVLPFIKHTSKRGQIVIASLPEYWWYHRWPEGLQAFADAGVRGFEIVNSAPKALDFPLELRRAVVEHCRVNNLFLTGISDNHGYGSATAAWNAMSIAGWREMDPDALEKAVLDDLKTDRFSAVQVLERMKFWPQTKLELFFSPVAQAVVYWRGLQPLQALVWTAWIWLAAWPLVRWLRN